jgi:hypothetical protein
MFYFMYAAKHIIAYVSAPAGLISSAPAGWHYKASASCNLHIKFFNFTHASVSQGTYNARHTCCWCRYLDCTGCFYLASVFWLKPCHCLRVPMQHRRGQTVQARTCNWNGDLHHQLQEVYWCLCRKFGFCTSASSLRVVM